MLIRKDMERMEEKGKLLRAEIAQMDSIANINTAAEQNMYDCSNTKKK